MQEYIRKYSIILIVLTGILVFLKVIVISQLEIVLLKNGIEADDARNISNTVTIYLPYLINVLLAVIILIDIVKNKIKVTVVVLLTFFSNIAGVIFFLFLVNNKIRSNDK